MTRQIVLGGAPANAPAEKPALPTIDPTLWAAIVPPERWAEFVGLIHDLRDLQRRYRLTMDPMLRRETEGMERRVDAWVEQLVKALADAEARAAEALGQGCGIRATTLPTAIVEGGVR